ncbi:MAG: glycosyltransferase family 39 protein [bacterium]
MEKNGNFKNIKIFVALIVLATILRLSFLSLTPLYHDEPAYSLRSIGMIDTLTSKNQPTPVDLLGYENWWVKLSFHDHPPLFFLINHISIKIFKSGLFGARLPSVFFGIATVIILFYIARKIFDEKTALLVAGLGAVNCFMVAYARVSMMESTVMFFILLSLYFFLLSLENQKYLPWFGLFFGISVMCKYTAVISMLAYIPIIIIYRRNYLVGKKFYFSALLFLIVISPLIIYNYYLFENFGHFDFQISSLLNQDTPMWGKIYNAQIRGSIFDRIQGLLSLSYLISPVMVCFFFSGLILFAFKIKKACGVNLLTLLFFTITQIFLVILIDSHARILYYSVPSVILLSSYYIYNNGFLATNQKPWKIAVGALLCFELLFCLNSIFVPLWSKPWGQEFLTYAMVYGESSHFDQGDRQIEAFFKNNVDGQSQKIDVRPWFYEWKPINSIDIVKDSFAKNDSKPIIVYDSRIKYQTYAWVFMKRKIYQNIPVFSDIEFKKNIIQKFIDPQIFNHFNVYYVFAVSPFSRVDPTQAQSTHLPSELDFASAVLIRNSQGIPVYLVYHLNFSDYFDIFINNSNN